MEEVRDDMGVRAAAVLGLHVEHRAADRHVRIVTEQHKLECTHEHRKRASRFAEIFFRGI